MSPGHGRAVVSVGGRGQGPPGLGVDQLRVADGQVSLEGEHHVAEDGAAEGDVVHRVEEVDEQSVVGLGRDVEGLHEGKLGHRRDQVHRVEEGHGHQDLVEHGAGHVGVGEDVNAHLEEVAEFGGKLKS